MGTRCSSSWGVPAGGSKRLEDRKIDHQVTLYRRQCQEVREDGRTIGVFVRPNQTPEQFRQNHWTLSFFASAGLSPALPAGSPYRASLARWTMDLMKPFLAVAQRVLLA